MIGKTILKTASYGVMHMSIAIAVAYALSRDWGVALAIGLIEPCFQTVAFFFHEQAWHKFEKKKARKDHHDSVIDSVSPAAQIVERYIRHKQ